MSDSTEIKKFLRISHLHVKLGASHALRDLRLGIGEREYFALVGASGSGKTVLAHTIAGLHHYEGKIEWNDAPLHNNLVNVLVVEQQNRFKDLSNLSEFYYQQRYNAFDAERTLTVREDIENYLGDLGSDWLSFEFVRILHIDKLLDEPLIQLSNGENKRLQLVKALLTVHDLLILDQPFIGLDKEGRSILTAMLNNLAVRGHRMLLITSPRDIPGFVTHVATMVEGMIVDVRSAATFDPAHAGSLRHLHFHADRIHADNATDLFEYAVRMADVSVRYGQKNILSNINWSVARGERWSLSGPNGAGKSTLLSLICGDNPQAYANEIYLFDRKRGSGESIWDIKKKIGFVSPELHLYFGAGSSVFQTVASGLFDTIGLFRHINAGQSDLVMYWLETMGLADIPDKMLSQISLGEQRLTLLARALIKNPPMLILDEPCQGLDEDITSAFSEFIDEYCCTLHATLIYVSHYLQDIPSSVNKFFRLQNGKQVVNEEQMMR